MGSVLIPFYDSVTPAAIPETATGVAGYVDDAADAWSQADFARFKTAKRLTITRNPQIILASILDVETGAADPTSVPTWVNKLRYIHAVPWVYCGSNNWQTIYNLCEENKVAQPFYWVAHPDGSMVLPKLQNGFEAQAKQYRWPQGNNPGVQPSPGWYDESVFCELAVNVTLG
jgi:hypothetical protein